MIPFLDVKATYTELRAELDAAYHRVMESGWFILGKETSSFEAELAAHAGAAHGIGVATGLDAIVLFLAFLEVLSKYCLLTYLLIKAISVFLKALKANVLEPTNAGEKAKSVLE